MKIFNVTSSWRLLTLCLACWLVVGSLPVLAGGVSLREADPDTLLIVVEQRGSLPKAGHSLRTAVAAANQHPGVTIIRFAPRLLRKKDTLVAQQGPLHVESYTRLIVQAPGPDQVTLSGKDQNQLFAVAPNAYLELHGLVLCEGRGGEGHYALAGGGIHNAGTLVMKNCLVTNNMATGWPGTGGGICNLGGTVVLDGCRLLGNTVVGANGVSAGGGLYSRGGAVVIRNSLIAGNQVGGGMSNHGGGLYCQGSTVEMSRTLVMENSLRSGRDSHYGGGLYLDGGEARLTDCAVAANLIEGSDENYGGGIYNRGRLYLTRCELKGNRIGWGQRNRGGGLYQSTGTAELADCSLVGNDIRDGVHENLGGGLFSFGEEVGISETCFHQNEAAGRLADVDGKLRLLEEDAFSDLSPKRPATPGMYAAQKKTGGQPKE